MKESTASTTHFTRGSITTRPCFRLFTRDPCQHAWCAAPLVPGRRRHHWVEGPISRRSIRIHQRRCLHQTLVAPAAPSTPTSRDYAERTIMQSRGGKLLPAARVSLLSLHIIRLASGCVQHRQDFVGGAEATGLQHWRRHRCERFELFARIGSQIDLCTLQAGVSEPK